MTEKFSGWRLQEESEDHIVFANRSAVNNFKLYHPSSYRGYFERAEDYLHQKDIEYQRKKQVFRCKLKLAGFISEMKIQNVTLVNEWMQSCEGNSWSKFAKSYWCVNCIFNITFKQIHTFWKSSFLSPIYLSNKGRKTFIFFFIFFIFHQSLPWILCKKSLQRCPLVKICRRLLQCSTTSPELGIAPHTRHTQTCSRTSHQISPDSSILKTKANSQTSYSKWKGSPRTHVFLNEFYFIRRF